MIFRCLIGVLTGVLAVEITMFATSAFAQAAESSYPVVVVITVEMPGGKSLSTEVSDADCLQKLCGDYYGIHGYVIAGLEKLGLNLRESCKGKHGDRTCEIIELGDVKNSSSNRWTFFRGGARSPYPYNRVTREALPEIITYKFLPTR